MSIYTDEVRTAVDNLKAHKPYDNLFFAIVEYGSALGIRVYKDNIDSFSSSQYQNVLEYLWLLRNTIQSFNIPCEIEGVEGSPPTKNRKYV